MNKKDIKFLMDLFEEQNWTNEKITTSDFETVSSLGYWLDYFFDIYNSVFDEPEEAPRYRKAINIIITALENKKGVKI